MISRNDYERYLEFRWGDSRNEVRKLRPIAAQAACRWLEADIIRRARSRIDPIEYELDRPFTLRGKTFTIKRFCDTDDDVFDGVCKFIRDRGCYSEPPKGNSGIYVVSDSYIQLTYSEDDIYKDARKYASKGVARRIAVLDRQATVRWVGNVLRGNTSFTSVLIECEEMPDLYEWIGSYQDGEEDQMHADIEVVLRSATSQT